MDDGFSRFTANGGFKDCEIATCGFQQKDLQKLKQILYNNFNINCRIDKSNRLNCCRDAG